MGYTYEKEQLKRLRRIVDRALAKIEAIEKGKISAEGIERFKVTLPVILKALDKLHPNKNDVTSGDEPIVPFVINIVKDDGAKGANN